MQRRMAEGQGGGGGGHGPATDEDSGGADMEAVAEKRMVEVRTRRRGPAADEEVLTKAAILPRARWRWQRPWSRRGRGWRRPWSRHRQVGGGCRGGGGCCGGEGCRVPLRTRRARVCGGAVVSAALRGDEATRRSQSPPTWAAACVGDRGTQQRRGRGGSERTASAPSTSVQRGSVAAWRIHA